MLGSIYIGLSGLSAYSNGLKSVSNNVSNLNTTGFKTTNVTFSGVYGSGSSGNLEYGYQYDGAGHGVTADKGLLDFSQGELRQTGRDLDLAIDGNGFLVLFDGSNQFFLRTGSFDVDEKGYVVLSGTKYRLAVLDGSGQPADVNVDDYRTYAPVKTTTVTFADNLSSTATTATVSDIKVVGNDGVAKIWTATFTRNSETGTDWTVKVTDDTGKNVGEQTLNFTNGAPDPATSKLTFTDSDSGVSVDFDFSQNVTSYSSGTVSSLRAAEVDGHEAGTIATLLVNDKGHLEITYTNDEKKDLGAVAVADFREPQRLTQLSNGLFRVEGELKHDLLAAEDTRVGTIRTKMLEASNVDLGAEFGDLILIQRGFQASSQVISVSNDMIQQLFGIRGGG
ncbi:flagellar hook-basal body complex protein [Novosphingobium beihaiensis]|uniref:Flagellar hook-basal body complex protein n=1 Tax=Novosphingobium beihaiensis TaxID=2930389 RepID=A0ABT0BPL8_9SPHN|nr:flagellar hook-basal body complex protein [Novosphingobium beihaiensis]MCJ2186984.1 flagellar hook-basal body complex protein [Novosphingobium beihaiensis]